MTQKLISNLWKKQTYPIIWPMSNFLK